MSYHRLPEFTPPEELIGFGSSGMRLEQSPQEKAVLSLVAWIINNYASDMSHVDFRVEVYRAALDIASKLPREAKYLGIPLDDLARSGAFGWHPGDEA